MIDRDAGTTDTIASGSLPDQQDTYQPDQKDCQVLRRSNHAASWKPLTTEARSCANRLSAAQVARHSVRESFGEPKSYSSTLVRGQQPSVAWNQTIP